MKLKYFATLACAGVICSSVLSSPANADPFYWEIAEVSNGVLDLPNETKIFFKVGSISVGSYTDYAIKFSKSETADGQEITRTVGGAPPKLTVEGDVIVTTWVSVPWGAYEETSVRECWRLGPLDDDYQETDCPTSD